MQTGSFEHLEGLHSIILDREEFRPWRCPQNITLSKADTHILIGAFFEHLAAKILGGDLDCTHRGSSATIPDLWVDRFQAHVEVKSVGCGYGAKVNLTQFAGYKKFINCKTHAWYFFFFHRARGVLDQVPRDLIQLLKQNTKGALLLDHAVVQALTEKPQVKRHGPYLNGRLECKRLADLRVTRDLEPLHVRSDAALCELGLNPEDYAVHRWAEATYTQPFIVTTILPSRFRKAVRHVPAEEETPF